MASQSPGKDSEGDNGNNPLTFHRSHSALPALLTSIHTPVLPRKAEHHTRNQAQAASLHMGGRVTLLTLSKPVCLS